MKPVLIGRVAVVLAAALLGGCATYIDRLAVANQATAVGDYQRAAAEMNSVLGVASTDELPTQWTGDHPLGGLERGMLQQALTSFSGSARDLSASEQALELLDLRNDAIGALGSYLYSDSVRTYKTPPSERLALNPLNLMNYLALGDLDGAAVEARRFQVMRDYLDGVDIEAEGPATLGTYLAGFVFEHRGEGDRALRYYEEALASGGLDSLVGPVQRLARDNPYRGPQISELLQHAGDVSAAAGTARELLIVVNVGRVPHKEPRRIPVGAAVGIAGALISNNADFLKYGAGKVVVYPELVDTPSSLGIPMVRVDGRETPVEQVVDLGAAVRAEYEEAKPRIMAAALTRMAARAGVAEGVRAAGSAESQVLGDVLSILVELTMVALDRPDTRSWTMMPGRVFAARVPVAAGVHEVLVSFGGAAPDRSLTVDTTNASAAAVVVTEPR